MKLKTLLLTTFVTTAIIGIGVNAFENPLTKYDLYADVHRGENNSSEYERGMSDFYNKGQDVPQSDLQYGDGNSNQAQETQNKRRNEVLRESSKKVYSTNEPPAAWITNSSYYSNPSLNSIIAKYKNSNFAGCMQEAESYVKKHPNDSLGYYYLAMSYTKVGDKTNAIKAYEKVIALHSNPMIVKYATNGRNCIMEGSGEACYQNVNTPDLIYPYANVAKNADLTPVNAQDLINRNLTNLENKLSPANKENNSAKGEGEEGKPKGNILPFSQQDEKLDKFIKAPYGNGLSPELDKEYKQLQLKRLQQEINTGEDTPEKDFNNKDEIRKFDKNKTDSDLVKLAYNMPDEDYTKNPEYIETKRELDQLNMLLGNDTQKSNSQDLAELLLRQEKEGHISPEMLQSIMMRDMMPDFSSIDL